MSTNLSVSFELICLMGWLLKKDKTALQQLIQKALAGGVSDSIAQLQSARPAEISDTMAQTVTEFFEYIEMIIAQGVPGMKAGGELGALLDPELKKLDQHTLDPKVVWLAISQTKEAVNALSMGLSEPEKNELFKHELYKNLLKNWTIAADDILN